MLKDFYVNRNHRMILINMVVKKIHIDFYTINEICLNYKCNRFFLLMGKYILYTHQKQIYEKGSISWFLGRRKSEVGNEGNKLLYIGKTEICI